MIWVSRLAVLTWTAKIFVPQRFQVCHIFLMIAVLLKMIWRIDTTPTTIVLTPLVDERVLLKESTVGIANITGGMHMIGWLL